MAGIALVESKSADVRPSIAQQIEDHHQIVKGYLDTHITRNHQESTLKSEERFFKRWFIDHGAERQLHLPKSDNYITPSVA